MKPLWPLLGILLLATPASTAPVLTRDLVSAGGFEGSAGPVRLRGSLGGFAFGTSESDPEILLIEGFWFPGFLPGSDVVDEILAPFPFGLDQNVPNPCRRQTTISYSVPGHGESRVPVRVEIFDVLGRRITTLANLALAPGAYTTQWAGDDAAGRTVPAGVYYCRFQAGGSSAVKTLVVLK